MVLVVEVVWEDSPASVLKVVSVVLVFVVVTPASVVTEVSVLKDTLVLPLKDTKPRAMAASTTPEATIAIIFFLLIFFSFLRSLPLKNFFYRKRSSACICRYEAETMVATDCKNFYKTFLVAHTLPVPIQTVPYERRCGSQ